MSSNDQQTATKRTGYATPSEVGEFYACSVNHIYNRIAAGEIPAIRVGKSIRVPWAFLHTQAAGVAR